MSTMHTQTTVKKATGKTVPMLKSRVSTRQLKLVKDPTDDDHITGSTTNVHQWMKRRSSVWPLENQNPYIDKLSQEEVTRVLISLNPQLPSDTIEFSFKDGRYIPVVVTDHNITLMQLEGTSLHIESQEAKDQLVEQSQGKLADKSERFSNEEDNEVESEKDAVEDEIDGDEVDEEELLKGDVKNEKGDSMDKKDQVSGKSKKLMNQFNFCERSTLTYNNPLRDEGTQTTPTAKSRFNENVTQWIIYDSYKEDYEMQQREKDRGRKEKSITSATKKDFKKKFALDCTNTNNVSLTTNIVKGGLLLERMINQNMFDDILYDFRYYEDPSDEFRENEGTLLPLWTFQFPESKKLHVTDIQWNPQYFDLFAVTFGSFDFQKQFQSIGYFCLWSLKNPSHPEYTVDTECGVMSVAFHHSQSYLIAIGLYDGGVAVYNIKELTNKTPVFQNEQVSKKHNGIVFQVQWGEDLADGEMVFYSISSDGYVYSWGLMQNGLSQTMIINLCETTPSTFTHGFDSLIKGSGTCITFHPCDSSAFLIGTEEGNIYKCSTMYLSTYLFIYQAHNMPVQRIDYNKFSSEIFVSCSADWSIKIWENERKEPLFIFDTDCSVTDVKWATYSSTVLAAVTADCKIRVFDLSIDKYKPICIQPLASKKQQKLTRLSFNRKAPIIVTGNDRGCVFSLKLSPNLRIKPKVPKKLQNLDPAELEVMKLEKILSLVREPSTIPKIRNKHSIDLSSE